MKAENQHRYRNSKTTYKGEIEDLDIPSDVEVFLETDTNPAEPGDVVLSTNNLRAETDRNDEAEFEKYLSAVREGEVRRIGKTLMTRTQRNEYATVTVPR
ncbi:hypothetical protein C8039_12245 [Halogeometricum sp. wsp3]|nr:hypothetical protein C8039_12245 [Halogeometricum sp. wsp3]